MVIEHSSSLFLEPDIEMTDGPEGVIYLKSKHLLENEVPSLLTYLYHWAEKRPDTIFLAERSKADPSHWDTISYAEILKQATQLATAFEATELSPEKPLMIISGNSIASATMLFAGYIKGVPVVPVSPSYSLLSKTFSKVKHIQNIVTASIVFAENYKTFEPVLEILSAEGLQVITADQESPAKGISTLADILATQDEPVSYEQKDSIEPNSTAKILFTSGSTGMPKGVINTHKMLTSNQEAIAKIWPFIEQPDNILLDWLPWHHTFGGNHNFNMVLRNGASLYIDGGKPAPGAIQTTIDNLQELSPTLYFNVAAGYDLLLGYLEEDDVLAKKFLKNLKIIFFAAAALPESIWNRLQAVIDAHADHPIPITSSWGTTETAPLSTSVYFPNTITNNIGVPVPGTELKLVPAGDLIELRVRGLNVMPAYFHNEEKTQEAFDEEGYFCSGDAVELVDPNKPELGILFKGRVSENFKLYTGTWVNVSDLRLALVAAFSPLVSDVVISGHNDRYLSLLIFPKILECQKFIGNSEDDIFNSQSLRTEIIKRLQAHNSTHPGSSQQIKKALLQASPPSFDDNETTDKGYLNQRGILNNRADDVLRLYSEEVDKHVINIVD